MKTLEEKRRLPIVSGYDIIIVGAGIAGIAAAVAASRTDKKVLLIEKLFGMGGLATLGNVIHFLPLCDGTGRKVVGGICEELLLLADQRIKTHSDLGFRKAPEVWGRDVLETDSADRYANVYNPSVYQIQLEEFVKSEGIDILYDTRFCDVIVEGERITHVIVENKDGRQAFEAKAFVDCSGDSDLFYAAGENTVSLDTSVLCGWHYLWIDGVMKLQKFTKRYSPDLSRDGADGPFFSGDNARDITDMVLQSRQLIDSHAQEVAKQHERVELFEIPSIPCFRATRRFNGEYVLSESDMHCWFEDTVAMTGDWRKRGPVYAIPLRTLQGKKFQNIFIAGRCIASEGTVWDVTRSIPTCGTTGHAAGMAAAMVAETGSIKLTELQARLKASGQIINKNLVSANRV